LGFNIIAKSHHPRRTLTMNNYITLFEKFIGLIDWKLLQACAIKHNTDFKTRSFFTHEHLASMIYFHVCEHDSLRHLNQSIQDNLSHILPYVSNSTLSHHNNNRDYKVFIPVMEKLIKTALQTLTKDERLAKFGTTKMIDSTTVSMCLTFFEWAKFRSTKSGFKMHTSIDGATGIPDKIIFSNAACHDRTKMDELMTDKETIYICDKGYIDYERFDKYTAGGIYFISRLKDNAKITIVEELPITYSDEKDGLLSKESTIVFDKKVRLGSEYINQTKKTYRIVKITDPTGKELTFVTNVMQFASEEIAWLYKRRWDIELFFKWIKQHCKIKNLIGHSENAVRLQMITGIITYLLFRLTWEIVPQVKSLIVLKRKIENLLLKHVHIEQSYAQILFSSS
ncbi:MAG: IS4 family transposase, partial [Cellulosilyticaceae bacterium]